MTEKVGGMETTQLCTTSRVTVGDSPLRPLFSPPWDRKGSEQPALRTHYIDVSYCEHRAVHSIDTYVHL